MAVHEECLTGPDVGRQDVAGQLCRERHHAGALRGLVVGEEQPAAAHDPLQALHEAAVAARAASGAHVLGHLDVRGHPGQFAVGGDDLLALLQGDLEDRHGSALDLGLHEQEPTRLGSPRAGVPVRFPPVLVGAGWHCGDMTQHMSRRLGLDDEQRYQAAVSKDPRFDGVFFIAVTSTGIYCRPSCPAITPKRENMRFYRSAAAAQEAGFRACKRCRPDASPGSPEWNIRADVVGRAMRLIADGVVDRDGVEGLASRLGYEQRQVRRLVTAELGRGPARHRPRAAGADGAHPDRDHRAAAVRDRLRGRLRQHQAVQRDHPRGLRADADPAAPGTRPAGPAPTRRLPVRGRSPLRPTPRRRA